MGEKEKEGLGWRERRNFNIKGNRRGKQAFFPPGRQHSHKTKQLCHARQKRGKGGSFPFPLPPPHPICYRVVIAPLGFFSPLPFAPSPFLTGLTLPRSAKNKRSFFGKGRRRLRRPLHDGGEKERKPFSPLPPPLPLLFICE